MRGHRFGRLPLLRFGAQFLLLLSFQAGFGCLPLGAKEALNSRRKAAVVSLRATTANAIGGAYKTLTAVPKMTARAINK